MVKQAANAQKVKTTVWFTLPRSPIKLIAAKNSVPIEIALMMSKNSSSLDVSLLGSYNPKKSNNDNQANNSNPNNMILLIFI